MKLDVMTGGKKLRDVAQFARDVEGAGLSGIVITESGRTPYLTATAAALVCNLDLATGVAVAFPRSPMVTASTAWELAELTGGRFRLGLGTQVRAHIERRYSAVFDQPGPRLREYVLALRAIFAAFQGSAKLDFQGEFYNFSLLPEAWSPGPIDHPNVPIDVAAVGPWMTRMAGEVADGVHVHPFHSTTYLHETLLPAVTEGARIGGRSAADVSLIVPVFTIVGDSEEARAPLKARAKSQIAFYGSTRNYAHIFDQVGFEGTSARLNERMKAGDMTGMADLITDEMLEQFAVTSTWDDLAGALAAKYQGTADRLVLYFAELLWRSDPNGLARLGEVAKALGG